MSNEARDFLYNQPPPDGCTHGRGSWYCHSDDVCVTAVFLINEEDMVSCLTFSLHLCVLCVHTDACFSNRPRDFLT